MKKIAIVFFLLVGITLGVGVLKFGVQDGIKINVMASLCALENRSHNNLMPEGLPVYEIEIDEDQWDELLADLPESGRDKKKVVFKHEGKAYKAKMKTRGHLKLHWGGHKKSIRVYFKGKSPFGTINQMNFINPKTYQLTNDHIGTWVGKKVGTNTIRNEMVFLRINGQNYGIMEMLEQPTNRFAINQNKSKMKVSLFKGDYLRDEDGNDVAVSLWKSAKNWECKDPSPAASRKLSALVSILNDDTMALEDRFKGIENHVDIDQYLKYYAALAIINTEHIDQSHNQVIVFDAAHQKYYPVLWDPTFMWSHEPNRFYNFCDPLSFYILQNPIWREQRDRYMYAFLTNIYDSGEFTAYHKGLEDDLWSAVKKDHYKCNPVGSNLDWIYRFSNTAYRHSNKKIRDIADDYYQQIKRDISDSKIEKLEAVDSILKLTYHTYSPLILEIECEKNVSEREVDLFSKVGSVIDQNGNRVKIKLYGQIEHEDGVDGDMYKLFSGFVQTKGQVEINIGEIIKNVKISNAITGEDISF